MPTIVEDKYYLKTLHEEIDLFDRKLAHLAVHETFASEDERATAIRKMTTKRENLAETARRLASDGIEFKITELPRSFRPRDPRPEPSQVPAVAEAAEPGKTPLRTDRGPESPFAGTALDWEKSITEYVRNRRKG